MVIQNVKIASSFSKIELLQRCKSCLNKSLGVRYRGYIHTKVRVIQLVTHVASQPVISNKVGSYSALRNLHI